MPLSVLVRVSCLLTQWVPMTTEDLSLVETPLNGSRWSPSVHSVDRTQAVKIYNLIEAFCFEYARSTQWTTIPSSNSAR
jgi:hypothetical protein